MSLSAPEQAAPGAAPSHRPRWRISRRHWRRTIQIAGLLGLLGLVGLIVLVTLTVGYTNPPPWVTDIREYRIVGRLSLILTVLLMAIVAITWALGIVAAVSGALALGGGSGTLRHRLRVIRRRLRFAVFTAVLLRLGLLAAVGIAGAYAYTSIFGASLASGPAYLVEQVVGRNPAAAGLLIPVVLDWVIGPWLRVRFSAALGALAASLTHGRAERVAFALAARFGVGLLIVLVMVWAWSGVLLVLLTLVDPVSYQSSVPFPSRWTIGGVPLALILISLAALVYPMGQFVFSLIFTRLTAELVRSKQKAASSKRSGL